jgi:hypothetical protein
MANAKRGREALKTTTRANGGYKDGLLAAIDLTIDNAGKQLNDDDFIDFLEQAVDRAQVALDARREELGKE